MNTHSNGRTSRRLETLYLRGLLSDKDYKKEKKKEAILELYIKGIIDKEEMKEILKR